MRNKVLYVYTENLNFFYRINNELNRLNIKSKILNIGAKLPFHSSVILTTSEDLQQFKNSNKNKNFLIYSKDDNFNHYILKVIAAYRIEYRNYYSELTFSIDPGTKYIGMVVFLDDYYLNSQTIYDEKAFIMVIKDYIDCFQKNNPNLLNLNLKFGRGIPQITIKLMKEIFHDFKNRNKMKLYLIDESKSSKIKIKDIKKRKMTKHEVSALILAFRNGFEINYTNNFENIRKNKFQKLNTMDNKESRVEEVSNDPVINLRDIIGKVLNNEISLSKSIEMLK
ncbi:MAG: hypothetical protein ACFE8L_09215 [Candidatus Hodarchaeota archaeon]